MKSRKREEKELSAQFRIISWDDQKNNNIQRERIVVSIVLVVDAFSVLCFSSLVSSPLLTHSISIDLATLLYLTVAYAYGNDDSYDADTPATVCKIQHTLNEQSIYKSVSGPKSILASLSYLFLCFEW